MKDLIVKRTQAGVTTVFAIVGTLKHPHCGLKQFLQALKHLVTIASSTRGCIEEDYLPAE
jgi:hypothetical protein